MALFSGLIAIPDKQGNCAFGDKDRDKREEVAPPKDAKEADKTTDEVKQWRVWTELEAQANATAARRATATHTSAAV